MVRILFVDDESDVLDGLKRGLRGQRNQWDMAFAAGGAEALAALGQSQFDVVVSELRMPRVDGHAVLNYAREQQPDAMRIVLSGQVNMESALRAVPVAHQFLSKPCDGEQVKKVIERSCATRELLTDAKMRAVLSQAASLPSSPAMYVELTRLLSDPETGTADVATVVEQDVGMSTKILQVVNSAFFGLPRELTSLRQAATFLGVKLIRAMVLSEEAFRPFQGTGAFTAEDLEAEQQRALRVASLARKLAPTPALAEHAYLGGMLHELGWLVAGCLLPEQYGQCQRRIQAGESLADVERDTLQASPGAIGAYLLGTWGLPLMVVEAVGFHHDPSRTPHDTFDVITAVHIAAALADEGRDDIFDRRAATLSMSYLESLGVADKVDDWRALATD